MTDFSSVLFCVVEGLETHQTLKLLSRPPLYSMKPPPTQFGDACKHLTGPSWPLITPILESFPKASLFHIPILLSADPLHNISPIKHIDNTAIWCAFVSQTNFQLPIWSPPSITCRTSRYIPFKIVFLASLALVRCKSKFVFIECLNYCKTETGRGGYPVTVYNMF